MKPPALNAPRDAAPAGAWGRLRLPAIAGSATGSLATAFAAQALLVISGVLAVRLLGPTNRGHLALFALLPVVITQVGLFGVQDALTYWIARDRRSAAGILRTMAWPIATQTLFCCLVHIAGFWLLARDEDRSVQIAGLVTLAVTPAYLAFNYGLAILKGLQHFGAINTLRLVPLILYGLALAPIFLLDEDRLPAVAVGWAAAHLVTAIAAIALTLRRLPRGQEPVTIPPRADLFRFGAKGFVGSASPLETFRLDQAVVGLFLSPAALGLYVASLAFTNLPRFVAGSVGTVAFPYIASQPDDRLARRSMWRFFWATVGCSLLIAAVLMAAARELVPLLFGAEFRDAVVPAQILLAGSVVGGARRILGEGLRGMGNPTAITVAEVASWIWLVPALVVLTPRWELAGVAVALLSASLCGLIVLAAIIVAGREPEPRLATRRTPWASRWIGDG
ncbi:MAG: lipopolysaccharide biosynthesis protein [Thermomicrobiales bacterium]